jgi:hypothetical protein
MAWVSWDKIHIDSNSDKERDLRLEAVRRLASTPKLPGAPRRPTDRPLRRATQQKAK